MIAKWSRMGDYHASTNGENQDALCSGENQKYTVISLADGVSSCREAKKGARIASNAITGLLLKKGDYFLEFDKKDIAGFTLSHILCELKRQTEQDASSLEDYSSTVASVLFDKENRRLLYFNLGDGAILGAGSGYCRFLAMPAEASAGCPVTTTRGASQEVDTNVMDAGALDSVIICSDGAWRRMVDHNRLKPEISAMLQNGNYEELQNFLSGGDCFDDSSFIMMDVRRETEALLKTEASVKMPAGQRMSPGQKMPAGQRMSCRREANGYFAADTPAEGRPAQ